MVTTHRDLESVVNTWNQSRGTAHSAVIHVGFSRPQTDAFEELCGRFPGKMLLTGSARYVFERIGPCAPTPVGTVDGIPVFVALSGWGYDAGVAWGQSLNADANPEVTRESQWGRLSADWLNDFQVSFPSEAETLRVVGIWNDKTYLELECRLPQPLRVLAGKCRFQFLAKGQDITSPFVVVRFAPPFVLEMPLEVIDLSVRSANVFRQQGIQRVSQLIELKDQDLLRFRNLGKKSLADISQAIRKVICPEMEYPVATGGYAESEIFESDLPTPHTGTESYRGMVERGSQRFSDAIEGILESLDERDAFILRKRMAWGDKWATHQEIGDQLKLSRQRIKQIEDVILEGVRKNQIWKEKMEAVIDQALTDRDTGLPLVGLEVVDAWFAGVVETEETFALALSQFGSNRFFVVKANDFSFVTSISQPEWDAVVVQASQLLEAASSLNWTKSMARENVGALLVDRGKEFREELFVSASKDAVFSSASDGVEPKLIAFGRGIEAQVEAVLTDSDRPLHYTEIAKRLTEKGRVISPAQVAGRVQRCGLLFNRGTYGLAKHLQFSEDEVASIVEAVEELVVTSPNRQWHCSEFVEMLEESGLEVDGRLTHYTVSIVLSRSDYLVDLGRFVWTANTAKPLATSDRMNKRQAIELLLRNEGRPMTHKEIRDRLFPQRGLGKVFQIFADEHVIRIREGVWGLFDRDVPINPSEIDRILCMIGKEIERTQKGLHVSEVTDLLKAKSDVESGPVDPILVLSLAQRNGRFRTNSAGFIYHNDWSDARRLRPPEALLQVLEQAGPEGLEAHELVEKATALLGREIHKYHIYNPLEAIGAKYNEATKRWQLIQTESNVEAKEPEPQQ